MKYTAYISVIPGDSFCSGPLPLPAVGRGERWGQVGYGMAKKPRN